MQLSDLHLALLGAAAVLLVALFGYGKWKERQVMRRLGDSVRGNVGDPLLDPRPAAGAASPPSQPVPAVPESTVEVTDLPMSALRGGRVEPRLAPRLEPRFDPSGNDDEAPPLPAGGAVASGLPPAPSRDASIAAAWVEDPKIDWVIELRCAHAVDGVALIDAALPLARLGSPLPMFLVAWDPRSQQWVEPDRFGFYMELLVATQLASRAGHLDTIAASRFIAVVQQMAVALDADFDVPDVRQMVAMADQLDQTVVRFDVTIGLTLAPEPGAALPDLAQVGAAAARSGLVEVGSARWELCDASGAAVVTLIAHAAPARRLTLELDVPLAPVAADPLRTLFAQGEVLARELGVRLVDDNGRPVTAASMTDVAPQLEALYAEMRAAGIEPAGARAQRLYA